MSDLMSRVPALADIVTPTATPPTNGAAHGSGTSHGNPSSGREPGS
jgi:hypothetical protein